MSDSDEYMDDSEYDAYENASDEDGSDAPNEDDEVAIEIENAYYEADDCKSKDPAKAIGFLEKVVKLEAEKKASDTDYAMTWTFKALNSLVLLYIKVGDMSAAFARYKAMLAMMDTVTQNECTDAINSVLEAVGASEATGDSAGGLREIYSETLEVLKRQGNTRMWFKTAAKLARVYLVERSWDKFSPLLADLFAECRTPTGEDDMTNATSLLQLYCMEIEWCDATGDIRRLKALYPKAAQLDSAVPNPRVVGTIAEIVGKMFMRQRDWERAYSEFTKAFQKLQEAGSASAKANLKYAVLANMLSLSKISPFDSAEAKAMRDDPEILALMKLRSAYQTSDCGAFHRIMHDKSSGILNDDVLSTHAADLLESVRGQTVLRMTGPYANIKLSSIALELRCDTSTARGIVSDLIIDGRLRGRLDSVTDSVQLIKDGDGGASHIDALGLWASKLEEIRQAIVDKV